MRTLQSFPGEYVGEFVLLCGEWWEYDIDLKRWVWIAGTYARAVADTDPAGQSALVS